MRPKSGFAPFASREAAADLLAKKLASLKLADPVVLALPRGGVPIGFKCAQAVGAPLDLLMVRKIGVPGQPELAAAAIVGGAAHELVLNDEVMRVCGLSVEDLQPTIVRELAEIERRRGIYLRGRKPIDVFGRSVVILDDGIATGTTLRAAIKALRRKGPKEIVVAVPLAPKETITELKHEVDRIICLTQPQPFFAIGVHYVDFHPVSDNEVMKLLDQSPGERYPLSGQ